MYDLCVHLLVNTTDYKINARNVKYQTSLIYMLPHNMRGLATHSYKTTGKIKDGVSFIAESGNVP